MSKDVMTKLIKNTLARLGLPDLLERGCFFVVLSENRALSAKELAARPLKSCQVGGAIAGF